MGDSTSGNSGDTDDLLISGVHTLVSAGSSLITGPQFEVSVCPSTPESQLLPAGAEASSLGRRSSAIRKLDFAQPNPQSQSSAEPQKSCFRSVNSPQKSTSVSFSNLKAPEQLNKPECAPKLTNDTSQISTGTLTASQIHEIPCEPWTNIKLDSVMKPLQDLSHNLAKIMSSENDRLNSSYSLDIDHDFRSYVAKLNMTDIRDMLETETLKKRYLEQNVRALQNRIMKLEERLCLSESMMNEQWNYVEKAEQCCTQIMNDADNKIAKLSDLIRLQKNETNNFKDNLTLAKNYNQTLAKRVEDLEIRLSDSENRYSQEVQSSKMLTHQNDSLREQVSKLQMELETKSSKLDKLEQENVRSLKNEDNLTKEVLENEKLIKQNTHDNQRLKLELTSEKTASKLFAEQKERESKFALDAMKREKEKQIKDLQQSLIAGHSRELTKVSAKYEEELNIVKNRIETVTHEREMVLNQLEQLESELDERKREMCHQVQAKLADKYRQLVAEFSNGSPPVTGRTTTVPTYSVDVQDTAARHFVAQFENIKPIANIGQPQRMFHSTQYGDLSGRRSHLQSLLLHKLATNQTPSDPTNRK